MNLLRNSLNRNDGNPGEFLAAMDDAVEEAIVPVRKYYAPDAKGNGADDVTFTNDRMFVASFWELTGKQPSGSSYQMAWVSNEGTGEHHDEQYLFYQNKGISVTSTANYAWLSKKLESNWPDSRADAKNINVNSMGDVWWTRSVVGNSLNSFWRVQAHGVFQTDGNYTYGVCPCFCL